MVKVGGEVYNIPPKTKNRITDLIKPRQSGSFAHASATWLSKGFAIANPPKIILSCWLKVRNQFLVSSWTHGFPSSDCSEFGFIGFYFFLFLFDNFICKYSASYF
jgi:hypothetical protein